MEQDGGYDVAIIGGGPVGSTAALAFAQRGARVLVLEANARAATRLAGEWLHPPAVGILHELGVDLAPADRYPTGHGFVVLPDDGSAPILLPYPAGQAGLSLHHEQLVASLRQRVVAHPAIDYAEGARATDVEQQRVTYRGRSGAEITVRADQIVGASGRTGIAHRSLGIDPSARTYSRMAGLLVEDVELPFEGYGHLCLGGPGPILAYRVSAREVRVCLDVPLSLRTDKDRAAALYEAYAPALPIELREGFRRSLVGYDLSWATNQTRLRRCFGREGFALVGDAIGHHHPLTAAGLTLGLKDALAASQAKRFDTYRRKRDREGRVPEVLAIALYDIFAGASDEAVRIRQAVYALWRTSEGERRRTMGLLSCDGSSMARFAVPFLKVLGRATTDLIGRGVRSAEWRHTLDVAAQIGASASGWVGAGALHLREAPAAQPASAGNGSSERFPSSMLSADLGGGIVEAHEELAEPARALDLGMGALVALQDEDGSWEGEGIWCAMLPAEYVLAWHVMGLRIPEQRQKWLLLHFARTRLPDGLWGLSEVGPASLFVTTLVYVASRMLGALPDDPLLLPARAFFDREGGAVAIPTWGKFWLALLNLYRWEGVNPVIPELWSLPLSGPVHPSRYYCHTRLIYLAMATLYAERFQAKATDLTESLRHELFPGGFEQVDFRAARTTLREGDLFAEPTRLLKLSYEVLRVVDRLRTDSARARLTSELRKAIRWELCASSYTSISPVSGLLNILALWADDPTDPDVAKAIGRFDCWIWEDDKDGLRVTGARSAIWDTSFALQALAAATPHCETRRAVTSADRFLASQQIRTAQEGYAENHRSDPRGGYPFSWKWHGWPVSDCTAEAILGRLDAKAGDALSDDDLALSVGFILRSQGQNGGFGSYEAPRVPFSLEWLNPAEMFGDSMTEAGYVECTASCIAALAKIATDRPHLLRRRELSSIPDAIARGAACIRQQQQPSGAWPGAWGVRLIYGTWFGVRGLLASGAPPTDPAIRKACTWLKAHQRPDGSWGERPSAHAIEYVERGEGQVVQTAWALMTLCEASDPDWGPLERAARFISRAQLGSGEWPRQDPPGLFFRTALLEYVLYRAYFPVWALAVFETRRKARAALLLPTRSFTRELAGSEMRLGYGG